MRPRSTSRGTQVLAEVAEPGVALVGLRAELAVQLLEHLDAAPRGRRRTPRSAIVSLGRLVGLVGEPVTRPVLVVLDAPRGRSAPSPGGTVVVTTVHSAPARRWVSSDVVVVEPVDVVGAHDQRPRPVAASRPGRGCGRARRRCPARTRPRPALPVPSCGISRRSPPWLRSRSQGRPLATSSCEAGALELHREPHVGDRRSARGWTAGSRPAARRRRTAAPAWRARGSARRDGRRHRRPGRWRARGSEAYRMFTQPR